MEDSCSIHIYLRDLLQQPKFLLLFLSSLYQPLFYCLIFSLVLSQSISLCLSAFVSFMNLGCPVGSMLIIQLALYMLLLIPCSCLWFLTDGAESFLQHIYWILSPDSQNRVITHRNTYLAIVTLCWLYCLSLSYYGPLLVIMVLIALADRLISAIIMTLIALLLAVTISF